ncbi:MAG: hypothetical protein OQK29_10255 [Ignavibacteriaceae bacterium]|nr:hypothetical protein [Ignavibacteriaceae bacterium]
MANTSKLDELITHIGNELKMLWAQLDAYQELYLVELEKRRPLLEATAPGFFAICQVSLAESILMRICRLMDPPRSCGEENSSLQNFCAALGADANHSGLQTIIQEVIDDWKKKGNGPYVALKSLRNKWLAHNDFAKRSALQSDQLWMPLTNDDFEVARNLASRLWGIYRQISRALYAADIAEPIHASLEDRPSTVLKRLCDSQFLTQLLEKSPELISQHQFFEHQNMGDDSLRKIFTT